MAVFPTHLFSPRSQRFYLMGRTITGGPSISGIIDAVNTSAGGLWVFELRNANLNNRAKLKAWRAIEALLDGGAASIIVPICDYRQAPVPQVNGKPVYSPSGGVPHSDGTFHDDGTGYSQSDLGGEVTVAAAIRATVIRVQMAGDGLIEGGEHFSVDHVGRRMYRVAAVTALGDGLYDLTIRPPLRAALSIGDELDFRHPSCLMRLASGDEMAPAVESLKFARGSVTFVEAFD